MHNEQSGQGQDEDGIGGQEPITIEGHPDEPKHGQALAQQIIHRTRHGALDESNVINHAGHPRSRMMLVQIRQGHALHMRKQLVAHVTNDTLADGAH